MQYGDWLSMQGSESHGDIRFLPLFASRMHIKGELAGVSKGRNIWEKSCWDRIDKAIS